MADGGSDSSGTRRGEGLETGDLDVGFGVRIPARELVERVSRSGGPGGQRTNKVATRVTLVWDVSTTRALEDDRRARLRARLGNRLTRSGELVVHAQSSREQSKNRLEARRRLYELVTEALRPPPAPRRPTRPTRGSVSRRLDDKRRRSDRKRSRGPAGRDDD